MLLGLLVWQYSHKAKFCQVKTSSSGTKCTSLRQHSRRPRASETVSPFVIPRQRRREIQNNLIFGYFPGFPFDFAQGGEHVEPRVSPNPVSSTGQAPYRVQDKLAGLARNDSFGKSRKSLFHGVE